MPDLTRAIYDAGARASSRRLAEFLRTAGAAELDISDPAEASEIFAGMVLGRLQLRLLYGLDPELSDPEARAREVARRFVRAYTRKADAKDLANASPRSSDVSVQTIHSE